MTGILQILFASYAGADTTITADFLVVAVEPGLQTKAMPEETQTHLEQIRMKLAVAVAVLERLDRPGSRIPKVVMVVTGCNLPSQGQPHTMPVVEAAQNITPLGPGLELEDSAAVAMESLELGLEPLVLETQIQVVEAGVVFTRGMGAAVALVLSSSKSQIRIAQSFHRV
jgi:hypothetical protein